MHVFRSISCTQKVGPRGMSFIGSGGEAGENDRTLMVNRM